jgi:hypothetical protein
MPKIVAENVIEVIASLMMKFAVPKEVRGAPAAVVGTVGGFSAALVSVAVSRVTALAPPASKEANRARASFSMGFLLVLWGRRRDASRNF